MKNIVTSKAFIALWSLTTAAFLLDFYFLPQKISNFSTYFIFGILTILAVNLKLKFIKEEEWSLFKQISYLILTVGVAFYVESLTFFGKWVIAYRLLIISYICVESSKILNLLVVSNHWLKSFLTLTLKLASVLIPGKMLIMNASILGNTLFWVLGSFLILVAISYIDTTC